MNAKNVIPLLQTLLDCSLEIAFSMTSKVVRTCQLALKMYLVFFSMRNLNYEIHPTKFYRITIFFFF